MSTPQFVSHQDALDIVFAHRNRAYGAYQLRREYPRTLRRALALGLLLIGLGLALPRLLQAFSAAFPNREVYQVTVQPLAKLEIETPPPPPPVVETPPPPTRATIEFVPTIVDRDENVAEEPPQNTVEAVLINSAEVGAKDAEGDPDAPITTDVPELTNGILESQPAPVDENVYDWVTIQKPPTFPGGERELLLFLNQNIKYPALARENNIQGNVALTFVINKDGSVSDITILKDIGGGCGKEALRVMNTMPKWSPGEANGHPVKVRFTLPVRFRLE